MPSTAHMRPASTVRPGNGPTWPICVPALRLMGLFLSAQLLSACSLVDRVVARAATGYLEEGERVFMREPDLQLAEAAIPANFKLLEILLARTPDDPRLNALASRYIATYAYAFVEPRIEELELTQPEEALLAKHRAIAFYQRGERYALTALAHRSALLKGLQGTPELLEQGLKTLTRADVPALFWAAFCWGSRINLDLEDPEALATSSTVKALMQRVLELDETYYYGGAHLFFGALNARLPASAGGNPEASRQHFERAIALGQGRLLMTRVFFARYYAVRVQDVALFKQCLERVLELDINRWPEERLANLEAQRRARFYLAHLDEYFLMEGSPPSP